MSFYFVGRHHRQAHGLRSGVVVSNYTSYDMSRAAAFADMVLRGKADPSFDDRKGGELPEVAENLGFSRSLRADHPSQFTIPDRTIHPVGWYF